MSQARQPRILLFGAGSVGAIYLWLLSKKAEVTAVCRSNYDFVKQNGFTINSSVFGEGIRFNPMVVHDCSEAAASHSTPFDYIVVCSKAVPGIIPSSIKPAVTPGHTSIVLVQNGIGIEQEYADAFPTNPIVSTVVYLPVTQRPPGTVKHGEVERLEAGVYPTTASHEPAKAFVELLQDCGGTAHFHEDVQFNRWIKLLVNASWNPICALTLSSDVNFMRSSPVSTDFVFAVMLEIAAAARAYGHSITDEEVQHQLGRAKARINLETGIEPSMLADVREGRRMEVEAIVGNTMQMAKEKGVDCVRLEALYILAKALDEAIARR